MSGPGVQQLGGQSPADAPPTSNFLNFPFRGCRPLVAALASRALTKGSGASPSPPQVDCPALLREIFPGTPRARADSGRYKLPVSALAPGPAADCQSLPWGLEKERGALVNPPSVAPRPLTHPTWERAAGSCWRCASTGRCAAATGPGAAPDPWQPPSLVIDRPLGRREPSLGDPGLRLYSSPSQDACAARSALGRGAGQMWPAIPGARRPGGGPRRPRRAAQEAGAPSPRRACARAGGVVGRCARVTHSSTLPGRREGNRKLLANSWAGPLAAQEPSSSGPLLQLPALAFLRPPIKAAGLDLEGLYEL